MPDIDRIWEVVIALLLAVSGGLARVLNTKGRQRLKWGRLFSEVFISGFAGIMMYLGAEALGAPEAIVVLLCGTAGYAGARVLDLLAIKAGKSVGIDLESDKKEED